MKKRLALVMLLLGFIVLNSVALSQGQEPTAPPRRTSQTRTPAPGAPTVPSVPSVPVVPSIPGVPSVPSVPGVPSVPSVPDIDPLGDVMFPPDLIMRHARELGLTEEQKSFMRSEIQRTTTRFNELQWQLQDAMEMLHQSMESSSVNEQQALASLDKVLDMERQIKHLHVGLGIRIKNHLTPEQKVKLQEIRRTRWPTAPASPRPTD